jgi:hypothetical protein
MPARHAAVSSAAPSLVVIGASVRMLVMARQMRRPTIPLPAPPAPPIALPRDFDVPTASAALLIATAVVFVAAL